VILLPKLLEIFADKKRERIFYFSGRRGAEVAITKSLAPMNSMFIKTQNRKREANFYVKTMNRKAEDRDEKREQKYLRKNVDRFENKESSYKSCWQRDAEEAERKWTNFANAHREIEGAKQKGKTFDALAKCLKIASRIINGDNVPKKDDKFLYENYPGMHMRAWLLRKKNDDPKDYESLVDDKPGGKRNGSMQDAPASRISLSPVNTNSPVSTGGSQINISLNICM
jgi:hypothetical protein